MSILRSCVALAAISLVALNARAAEVIPPKPERYFNDYAGVVSQDAALRFNEQLAQFERETSNQVVVAVFPKMQSDDDVAAYTQRVAQSWGVGQKGERNGVVLFVFTQDRKMFIQVGYGLEGALPDITAFDITENRIKPHLRNNDYEGGLREGIDSILKATRGEYKGTGKTVRKRSALAKVGLFLLNHPALIIIIVVLFWPRLKPRRGYHYSGSGGRWAWAYGGGGGSSGGSWSSGGGGGFSGFSGGGGSFGGGGAGSSW
jgi:uncharacterized protein